MLNYVVDEWIEKEARRIFDIVKDTKIFGRKVNLEDQNELIVAAYYLGRKEELDVHTTISGT